jgi:phospholipid/cholesterol/gamma-HCH transport system substrate-binding protein
MRSLGTETKVGIFVVLGILILSYFTVRVGRIAVREVGYRVYTLVESATGLDKNSPVRIAGVQVGRVESIVLEKTKAKVALLMNKGVQIPAGSKVYVRSTGLLGEKHIEIIPGAETEMVQANGLLEEGGPSVDVDRVLQQLSSIGGDIQSVTQSLRNTLGGEKGEQAIQTIVTETRETMANLKSITQTIDRGEGTLGKLVKDDGLYREVKETVSNLSQVSRAIEKGEGTLGKLVKDEALYEKTKEAMEQARSTLAQLNQVASSIEKGEGTLGKLVKDDTLYEETKGVITEAKETLSNLRKVSEEIEQGKGTIGKLVKDETLYDEAKQAIKSVNKAAEGIDETTPVTVLGVLLGIALAR